MSKQNRRSQSLRLASEYTQFLVRQELRVEELVNQRLDEFESHVLHIINDNQTQKNQESNK